MSNEKNDDVLNINTMAALERVAAGLPLTKDEVPGQNEAPLIPRKVTSPIEAMAAQGTQSAPTQVVGYEELERILKLAYNQAASGKGKQRHSKQAIGFRPWHEQPILQIARMVGTGGHAYQVQKKVQEAVTMQGNGNFAGAKAEVLGAIVYAAAMYKLLEEVELANDS